MVEPQPNRMSYASYLEAEQAGQTKHEFLRGEVYAMAGGTPEHGALAAAVIAELSVALRGHPCRVYTSDVRVRVDATDLTTYPDVSVVCGELRRSEKHPHALTNPVLIVEVLSDSTEAYDRGEKFAHYRRLPSVREYLLVSQREPRLESFRRTAAGEWVLSEAGAGETLSLASLDGVRLEVDLIYRDPLISGAET